VAKTGVNMVSATEPLAFPLHIPFVQALGVELWAFANGHAELRMNVGGEHTNSWAVAHGGVLMTLLDVAMAHAARSGTSGEAASPAGVATIEMKTAFMRPAEGRLRATGSLLHKTATMAFTEGHVFNEAGELCAHASGTFKFLRALPTTGRELKPLQTNPEPSP
jgi:uncharacterized protein (TIGR00369 family)